MVIYGLWLNPKGRVLADSFVFAGRDNDFWIGSYFSPPSVIQSRLVTYIIADDVEIEDQTGDWSGLTIFGARELQLEEADNIRARRFSGRRAELPCTEWVFRSPVEKKMTAHLKVGRELSAAEMERMRIIASIPSVPVDIGPTDLPNEGGLDQSAVSYSKGCYLGQEVMARLKAQGRLRRRLVRVRGAGPQPLRLTALYQEDRKIGDLRSAIPDGNGYVGLAMLTLLGLRMDAPLSIAPNGFADIVVVDQL